MIYTKQKDPQSTDFPHATHHNLQYLYDSAACTPAASTLLLIASCRGRWPWLIVRKTCPTKVHFLRNTELTPVQTPWCYTLVLGALTSATVEALRWGSLKKILTSAVKSPRNQEISDKQDCSHPEIFKCTQIRKLQLHIVLYTHCFLYQGRK